MEKSNATTHTDGRRRRPFSVIHNRQNKQEKPRKNHPFLRRFFRPFTFVRLHPLVLLLGVWYAVKGDLFLFLMSTLVALQHECAHAFAAAKLGYKLNAVVLMPFGAVIDGDLRSISLKGDADQIVGGCRRMGNDIGADLITEEGHRRRTQ